MMQYIPKDTTIKSTSEVINIFDRPKRNAIEGGPGEDEEAHKAPIIPES
jgi:hypothetical protein